MRRFLSTVNLLEAVENGYLSVLSDGALRFVSQRLSKIGNWQICGLHCLNSLFNRSFEHHFEDHDKQMYSKYVEIQKMFKDAAKIDPVVGSTLNDYLQSVMEAKKFHAESKVRFRSRFENIVKMVSMRNELSFLRGEGKFELLDNIDLEFGSSLLTFMEPVYEILCTNDTDNNHSSGALINQYTHLYYRCQTQTKRGDKKKLIDQLKSCLKISILEQLFTKNKHVPVRVSPVDFASQILWPPTR